MNIGRKGQLRVARRKIKIPEREPLWSLLIRHVSALCYVPRCMVYRYLLRNYHGNVTINRYSYLTCYWPRIMVNQPLIVSMGMQLRLVSHVVVALNVYRKSDRLDCCTIATSPSPCLWKNNEERRGVIFNDRKTTAPRLTSRPI